MNQDIKNAVQRANDTLASGKAAWQPVFVDVLSNGVKVGHLASDGYTQEEWDFYPIPALRSQQIGKWGEEKRAGHLALTRMMFDDAIPKWVTDPSFGKAQTYREREAAR